MKHNFKEFVCGKGESENVCTNCHKVERECEDQCFNDHKILECLGCDGESCFICQPGPIMHICIICGGVNESLTTKCRSEALDGIVLRMVAMGQMDYDGSNWIRPNVVEDLRFK